MDTFKLRKIFIFWLHCSNNNWRDINVNNFTIPIVHHIFRHNCTYESTCMRRNYLESLINQQKHMRWSKLRKEQFWNHKRSKLTGSECHNSTKNILKFWLELKTETQPQNRGFNGLMVHGFNGFVVWFGSNFKNSNSLVLTLTNRTEPLPIVTYNVVVGNQDSYLQKW